MKVMCIKLGLTAPETPQLELYKVYTVIEVIQSQYRLMGLQDFYVLEEIGTFDMYIHFLFSPFTDEEEKQLQCQITEKEPVAVGS